jgi:hypothetical protein
VGKWPACIIGGIWAINVQAELPSPLDATPFYTLIMFGRSTGWHHSTGTAWRQGWPK